MGLDWFSGQEGSDARCLELDKVIEVSRYGEKKWEIEKWRSVGGSFVETMLVKRCSPHLDLWLPGEDVPGLVYQLSGNPTKFLQGHNCFAPPVSEMHCMVLDCIRHFPEDMRPEVIGGGLHASRVDISRMVQLSSHEAVHVWLEHAGRKTRSRHGRPLVSGHTVYWGKHSRRWSIKAYCKLCEFEVHPSGLGQGFDDLMRGWLCGQLRIELTLRGEELKLHKDELGESLVWSYFERLECGVMRRTEKDLADGLPLATRLVYEAWKSGFDVSRVIKQAAFYKHRRRVLDVVGVDLASDPEPVAKSMTRDEMSVEFLQEHEVSGLPDGAEDYLWSEERSRSQLVLPGLEHLVVK